jgi:tRNA U34 5-methylaminomethyl-2-thiouridine-forming methyltransferase MnmC
MKSPRWALGLLLAAASSGPAAPVTDSAAGAGLDSLLALMAQRRHGEAAFSENKYLSMLKQPLESSGLLIYDAPDHLEQRTTQPRPQSVVLDHGIVTMQIGQRRRVVKLADYPQLAPLIDSIRATLAGDRAALERVFELEFSGTLEHWQLRLEPRAAPLTATLKRIDMQGQRDAVDEVQVWQSDGDHSIMSITPRE